MARKRIKTLAIDWNVPVADLLASCERLRLGHARSDSSLLAPEEAERVRADLAEQAHRASILRRETVVETSAGTVVEKRLGATVVRRRHTEPSPAVAAEPFHFEVEQSSEASFDAHFLEEKSAEPSVTPVFVEPAPAPRPAPAVPELAVTAALEPAPALQPDLTEVRAESSEPAAPVAAPRPSPSVQPRRAEDGRAVRPQQQSPSAPQAISLTRASYAGAPTLDDGQRGPRVLGKIDLRAKPVSRPAPPTGRPGAAARPAGASRFGAASEPAQPIDPMAPPGEAAKPGSRSPKKKKVVKKDAPDFLAEREMRGLRVPKKRRALPGKEQKKTEITTPKASKRVVRVTEGVTVGDLARNMGVKAGEIIKKLMDLGQMATLNQVLDVDTASLIANEFGYTVESVGFDEEATIEEVAEQAVGGEAVERPPVVTVMGHVDHGKTSLLDAIRKTNVTAHESGGITQHIGAYTVEAKGKSITFVDTPGHEAFTSMRARGAKVTDMVVLVVSAAEGVMPQTVEAVNHARAAKAPIVVAINKIDLPDANIDRVKQRLTELGLIPEDYGGDTITVPVSARTGEGIDKLLEMLLLQSEVLELKANRDRPARGTVIESQLDRGRGPVATVLVQEGMLRQGDSFVCGTAYGRVRAMQNHLGQRATEAGPSTPVEIFGLSSVPEPGMAFTVVAEESKARQVAEYRLAKRREGELQKTSRVSLEDFSARMAAGEVKELKVIIKGDVHGSVEALADALARLSTGEVKLEVILASAGAISETDITLASASRALVVGFNVRPEPKAAALAEKAGVEIRLYTIIYEAINDVREALEGLLAPTYREKQLGRAEVRQIFNVPGATIAGCMVTEGKVARSARARLVRDGRVVLEGKIGSLKRFKDDAREVLAGYECGIGLENFNDVKPEDVIETFEMEAVLRKLTPSRPEPARGGQAAVEKQLQT